MYHPHAFLISNKDPSPNGEPIFRALTQENKLEFKTSLKMTSLSQGTFCRATQHLPAYVLLRDTSVDSSEFTSSISLKAMRPFKS